MFIATTIYMTIYDVFVSESLSKSHLGSLIIFLSLLVLLFQGVCATLHYFGFL